MTTELINNPLNRLAAVVMDSNDAITLLSFDWHILAWNRGAERLFGFSEAEALAMSYFDIVPRDARDRMRLLPHRLKLGADLDSCMTRRRRRDGRVLDVWLTMTLVRNDRGVPDAIATTERDVTQLYRATSASSRLVCLTVADVMTKRVVSLTAGQRVDDATRILTENGAEAAPILDENQRCIGLFPEVRQERSPNGLNGDRQPDTTTIGRARAQEVPHIHANEPLIRAARVMCDAHTDHLLVVDDRRWIVGMLSTFDLISALYQVFEE